MFWKKRLENLKYNLPTHSSSLVKFVENQEKEAKFIKNQIESLKATGEVPKYSGTFELPPPTVSPKILNSIIILHSKKFWLLKWVLRNSLSF